MKHHSNWLRRVLFTAAALLAALSAQAQADVVYWGLDVDGVWDIETTPNWRYGTPSGSWDYFFQNDSVYFARSAGGVITVDAGTQSSVQPSVMNVSEGDYTFQGDDIACSGGLSITGGSMTATNSVSFGSVGYIAQSSGSTGALIIDGGNVDFSNQPLFVADNGTGYLSMSNGTCSTTSSLIVGHGDGGVGTFDMDGDSLLQSNGIRIGGRLGSEGVWNISGGTANLQYTETGSCFILGHMSGATGTVNQSGGLVITGYMNIGEGNTGDGIYDTRGVYNLSGGELRINWWRMAIGDQNDSVGILNMTGGILNMVGGDIELGNAPGADGSFYFSNGVVTAPGRRIHIGKVNEATGYAEQSGGAATYRGIRVGSGSGGTGTYDLKGGTIYIADREISVGHNTDSVGTMNVSGGSISFGYIPETNYPSGFTDTLVVGRVGLGTVNQDGGLVDTTGTPYGYTWLGGHEVTVTLPLDPPEILTWTTGTTGVGIYNLSDNGSLTTLGLIVGGVGAGTFNQSGGTVTATSSLANSTFYALPDLPPENALPSSLAAFPYNLVIGYGGESTTTATGVYNLSGGMLNLDAGAGSGILIGHTGSGTLNITGGVANLGGGAIDGNASAQFNFQGGTLKNAGNVSTAVTFLSGGSGAVLHQDAGYNTVLNDTDGAGGFTKTGPGTLTLSGTVAHTGTTVLQGGTTVLMGDTPMNSALTNSRGDLQAGKLVIDYSDGTTGVAEAVLTILDLSYGDGSNPFASANGAPIFSSTADAMHGLGWADDAQNELLTIAYTIYGDADLNGVVGASDLGLVLTNFGSTSVTWSMGDFDYNGVVGASDLGFVLTNFGASLPASLDISGYSLPGEAVGMLAGAGITVVPEPSTLTLLAVGLTGLIAFARRRRK